VKPAVFDYLDPTTLDEALAQLARLGDDGKVLAGGQSLVPLMNFRLARPAVLVDLNRVPELSYLREQDGFLTIGAMTRQRALERSEAIRQHWPILVEAAEEIGHVQIRNRGTVGGSLAHADPAAELPAVMTALEAELVVRSQQGQRTLGPEEFFLSYLTTALEPQELLTEIRVPRQPAGTGWSFMEISRRHGDFALVGVAALVTLDDQGRCSRARLALTGVAPIPVRPREAEQAVLGQEPSEAIFREAGAIASRDLEPEGDLHASAEYRKEVSAVLVRRALLKASERARGGGS
jgi:CO/xanthine dehydrogenase FAD-binding subunit